MRAARVTVLASILACLCPGQAPEPLSGLLQEASQALEAGRSEQALAAADRAVNAYPERPEAYLFRARMHEQARRFRLAIEDYTEAIRLRPKLPQGYQGRGAAHFKLGEIEAALRDFDRVIELLPEQEPYHWQRGIAYYYAGQFQKGKRQFELYQRVRANDVENAVWHFLCNARLSGFEQAREELLSIKNDPRAPMMEIYDLFRGTGSGQEVIAAADAASPAGHRHAPFSARLYLSLYHEARGDEQKARELMLQARELGSAFDAGHYMVEVARVHIQQRGWD